MMGQEPRQTTSNLGLLNKPSIVGLVHGLNKHYYSININYRKNELEQKMLLNLYKKKWTEGLRLDDMQSHQEEQVETLGQCVQLANNYTTKIDDEMKKTKV